MQPGKDFFDHLEDDIAIDKFRLDKEWLNQPQLYLKYAMASAYFNKEASLAAEQVKVIQANLELDAAEDPDACLGKGVKPTIERCKGYALSHPEMERARHKAANAKFNADMALNAVFAFNQRKDALEHLVRLQGMEIYSTPQAKDRSTREGETQVLQRAATDAVKQHGLRRRRT